MKVIAINGSPREDGNTAVAISAIAEELKKENIETEIITIGKMKLQGCTDCRACQSLGKCAINDGVNEIVEKMKASDGIIIGSPVYYADINGTLKCFLDRAFFSSGPAYRFKPGVGVVSARRSGITHAFQSINQYFEINEMLIVPSVYWNGVHGGVRGEAAQDIEGIQVMHQIGKNMAFLIKAISENKDKIPTRDQRVFFNYIR